LLHQPVARASEHLGVEQFVGFAVRAVVLARRFTGDPVAPARGDGEKMSRWKCMTE